MLKIAYLSASFFAFLGWRDCGDVAQFGHTKNHGAYAPGPMRIRHMNFDTPTLTTKIAMATALMAGVTCGAQAAPVVFYDFEQGVDGTTFSNAVESLGTGISSATAWSIGAGTLQSRQGVDQSGAPAGTAILLGSWDENQFFEFKFTVEPDAVLTLTGLKFWERFTGTGSGGGGGSGSPQVFSNWNLLVNGIERASGAASAAAGVSDPYALTAQTLDVAGLTGEVTIRITADGPYVAGRWSIDNFELTGDVAPVPVPAAAWLFGSAVLGLGAMRRRKAS